MEQAKWEEEQEEMMRRREKLKLQDHERQELLEVLSFYLKVDVLFQSLRAICGEGLFGRSLVASNRN